MPGGPTPSAALPPSPDRVWAPSWALTWDAPHIRAGDGERPGCNVSLCFLSPKMVPLFNPTPRGECGQEGPCVCLTPVTARVPGTSEPPALPVPLPSLSRHLPSPRPGEGTRLCMSGTYVWRFLPGPSKLCNLCFRWDFPALSPELPGHTHLPLPFAPHTGGVVVKNGPAPDLWPSHCGSGPGGVGSLWEQSSLRPPGADDGLRRVSKPRPAGQGCRPRPLVFAQPGPRNDCC